MTSAYDRTRRMDLIRLKEEFRRQMPALSIGSWPPSEEGGEAEFPHHSSSAPPSPLQAVPNTDIKNLVLFGESGEQVIAAALGTMWKRIDACFADGKTQARNTTEEFNERLFHEVQTTKNGLETRLEASVSSLRQEVSDVSLKHQYCEECLDKAVKASSEAVATAKTAVWEVRNVIAEEGRWQCQRPTQGLALGSGKVPVSPRDAGSWPQSATSKGRGFRGNSPPLPPVLDGAHGSSALPSLLHPTSPKTSTSPLLDVQLH